MKFVIKIIKTGQNSEHAYICTLQYENPLNICVKVSMVNWVQLMQICASQGLLMYRQVGSKYAHLISKKVSW